MSAISGTIMGLNISSSAKKRARAAVLRLAAYLLIAYVAVGAFLYFRQSALIYPAPKIWANSTPAKCGLQFEDVQIPVASNGHVHAWWIPAAQHSEKAVLVLHGNGYVIEDMVGEEVTALHEIGANLLIIDYRGYGLSTPISPCEMTIVEDARAALLYLLQKRYLLVRNVFVLGRSIGTGPATKLVSETKSLGGLILESPLTSIDAISSRLWVSHIYPVSLLLNTHFDNLSKIRSIEAPLLVVSGTADTLTPTWMAKAIFASARPPKKLYFVEQADHDDLVSMGGISLVAVLRNFVDNALLTRPSR